MSLSRGIIVQVIGLLYDMRRKKHPDRYALTTRVDTVKHLLPIAESVMFWRGLAGTDGIIVVLREIMGGFERLDPMRRRIMIDLRAPCLGRRYDIGGGRTLFFQNDYSRIVLQ